MGTGRTGKNGEQDAENGDSCKKAAYIYIYILYIYIYIYMCVCVCVCVMTIRVILHSCTACIRSVEMYSIY